MKNAMIEVKGLSKAYGDLLVLDDISTTIWEGEKVAVIGPSGSGKSTFLRCLNCMEDPSGGAIIFDGEDLADMRVDILQINVQTSSGGSLVSLKVGCKNTDHYSSIVSRLRSIPGIYDVSRGFVN